MRRIVKATKASKPYKVGIATIDVIYNIILSQSYWTSIVILQINLLKAQGV